MPNHDLEMLTYLKLAELSQRKRQQIGRDKLLVLAGVAACETGCLTVAARCREVVLKQNRRHLLSRHDSFPDALRSDDFAPLLKRLRKLLSFEQAEFLARQWNLLEDSLVERGATEIEADALKLLSGM